MDQPPRVSVVTICFNSARTVERTVTSVLEQTYPNVEFVVVDGGSTDGTLGILGKYRGRIASLTSEPDAGIYDAMNKGVQRATGDWIHILNSDDFYAGPRALEQVVPCLDLGATNYSPILRQLEDGSRELQDWKYRRWRLFVSAFLPHPGLVVSREQYRQAGLYDTRYRVAADHDMILRLTRRWPGLKHGVPLTVMQQGGYSEVNAAQTLKEFRDVTIAHGLPRALAASIYQLKRLWWRA